MRRNYLPNPLGMQPVVRCLFAFQLICLVGCQPAVRPNPPVIEAVDLPRIDTSTFESEVIKNPQPVLVEVAVDFGCPACEAMKPHVTKVVDQVGDDFKIVRLDHRSNRQFAQQIGAIECPSYLIFSQGQLVDSIAGQTSADMLLDRLYSHVPKDGSSNPTSKDHGG